MNLLLGSHQDVLVMMGAIVTLVLATLLQGYSCLKLIALHVPESIFVGEIAKLSCIFDEEHEQLYSVKWYKDDVEFFRFLPNDRPANQFFDTADVNVDMSRSSNGNVTLLNASHLAEGNYRCEVSVDAPSFQSTSQEKYMAVEDRPPVNLTNGSKRNTLNLTVIQVIFYAWAKLLW